MSGVATCRDCGEQWTGMRVCHCTNCHLGFSTENNFTRHQEAPQGCTPWDGKKSDSRKLSRLLRLSDRFTLIRRRTAHGHVYVEQGSGNPWANAPKSEMPAGTTADISESAPVGTETELSV